MLLLKGLGTTLVITLFACMLGIIIGLLVSLMKLTEEKKGRKTIWSRIANVYIDIIRGTPAVIQLLIMYQIVFAKIPVSKVIIAIFAFGINSGAYVAEIFRGGIQSVDKGQMEAGRSLGFTYKATMKLIIIPQAIKNILPALGNEFIVLLKETSIVGYISLIDLTKAGDFIVSRTYSAYVPLLTVAVIYFIIVKILTKCLQMLERRLRQSDIR